MQADRTSALFVWLISHQPAVLFSQNKSATSNQPTVLFSQNKSAPAISHQPNEQAAHLLPLLDPRFQAARASSGRKTIYHIPSFASICFFVNTI
jgi:hypothetical protein